jgi:hypothetical protein
MSLIAGHALCRMQSADELRPKYNENRILVIEKPGSAWIIGRCFSHLGLGMEPAGSTNFRPAINESQPP